MKKKLWVYSSGKILSENFSFHFILGHQTSCLFQFLLFNVKGNMLLVGSMWFIYKEGPQRLSWCYGNSGILDYLKLPCFVQEICGRTQHVDYLVCQNTIINRLFLYSTREILRCKHVVNSTRASGGLAALGSSVELDRVLFGAGNQQMGRQNFLTGWALQVWI